MMQQTDTTKKSSFAYRGTNDQREDIAKSIASCFGANWEMDPGFCLVDSSQELARLVEDVGLQAKIIYNYLPGGGCNTPNNFSRHSRDSGNPVLSSATASEADAQSLYNLLPHIHCLIVKAEDAHKLALKFCNSSAVSALEKLANFLHEKGLANLCIFDVQGEEDLIQDYFFGEHGAFWLSSGETMGAKNHTSSHFAALLGATLSLGYCLKDAVVIARMAINQARREAINSDKPPEITKFPCQQIDLPILHSQQAPPEYQESPNCSPPALGLYPVVPDSSWIRILAEAGVTCIQLRNKSLQGQDLDKEIHQAIQLAARYSCRLFINDHWQLAIKYQAYGVHLGQEDLETADLTAIKKAKLRLGISSHCHYEVAKAHGVKPSYIACGPVFPTSSKIMPWQSQGVAGLNYWKNTLSGYPLVAIGGIDASNIQEVAEVGVAGIAMISALTEASNVEVTAKNFQAIAEEYCQ